MLSDLKLIFLAVISILFGFSEIIKDIPGMGKKAKKAWS